MCFLRPDILCFFDSNSNGICSPHSDLMFIFVGLILLSVSGCTYSFLRLGCGFAFAFSLRTCRALIFVTHGELVCF